MLGVEDDTQVRSKARIFGQSGKQLTKYQEKVNEMAGEICASDPALLASRNKLFELAQDKVRDTGYQYKKGKSRSKKVLGESMESGQTGLYVER